MNQIEDAFIIKNSTLTEFIREHRAEQLELLLNIRKELNMSVASADSMTKYGKVHSKNSILIDKTSHPYLQHLLTAFRECLPEYDLVVPEIWLGNAEPVAYHNDAALFLESGREVSLQFWVLLESCTLAEEQEPKDANRDKNALECLLPTASGILFPNMKQVLVPNVGLVDFDKDKIIGGDQLEIGDTMLFKNGVIHYKGHGSDSIFRGALAFRAMRKDRIKVDRNENEYLMWFLTFLDTYPDFKKYLAPTPYFIRYMESLNKIQKRPLDRTQLSKLDRNDYGGLKKKLEEVDFGSVFSTV